MCCVWRILEKNSLKAAKNVLLSTLGIKTGLCLNSTGTCEINGWCPVEDKKTPMWDPSLVQNFGNFPFCANVHSDPPHWPRYFTGLFITDKACQGPLFFFTQLSFLSHFQRALTEQSWELHHLHQEFHQVSQVWVLQVSSFDSWCKASGNRSQSELRIYVFEWLLEITLWRTELSIYTSLFIALSGPVKQSSETPLTAGHALDRCQIRSG